MNDKTEIIFNQSVDSLHIEKFLCGNLKKTLGKVLLFNKKQGEILDIIKTNTETKLIAIFEDGIKTIII